MQLPQSVTLNIHGEEITLDNLDFVIIDHPSKKAVLVRLAPFLRMILLWKENEYDTIGDYTQAQVENKILEILGEDLQTKLQSLVL